jgi:hypothetical protein
MTPTEHRARALTSKMIDDLQELISALDRRVPRLERTGELDIAHDAAALRSKALDRIAKLGISGS